MMHKRLMAMSLTMTGSTSLRLPVQCFLHNRCCQLDESSFLPVFVHFQIETHSSVLQKPENRINKHGHLIKRKDVRLHRYSSSMNNLSSCITTANSIWRCTMTKVCAATVIPTSLQICYQLFSTARHHSTHRPTSQAAPVISVNKLEIFTMEIQCLAMLQAKSQSTTVGSSHPHFHKRHWSFLPSEKLFPISLMSSSQVFQVRQYSIKRKNYKFPELKPEDLDETFVRGSGPGGQAVNQTANCVVLKHKPSGIVIKCHETRSLQENRNRARQRLEEKLDLELHGEQSYLGQVKSEIKDSKQEMKRRANKRLALKKAFKEREGLD